MRSNLKQFRTRALKRTAVRKAYDALEEEFAFLNEELKARAEAQRYPQALGISQKIRLVKG